MQKSLFHYQKLTLSLILLALIILLTIRYVTKENAQTAKISELICQFLNSKTPAEHFNERKFLHYIMNSTIKTGAKVLFFKKLLEIEGLKLDVQDESGNTLLHLIAASSSFSEYTEIAGTLINKNRALLNIKNRAEMIPLHLAYKLDAFSFFIESMDSKELSVQDSKELSVQDSKELSVQDSKELSVQNKQADTVLHFLIQSQPILNLTRRLPLLIEKSPQLLYVANDSGFTSLSCLINLADLESIHGGCLLINAVIQMRPHFCVQDLIAITKNKEFDKIQWSNPGQKKFCELYKKYKEKNQNRYLQSSLEKECKIIYEERTASISFFKELKGLKELTEYGKQDILQVALLCFKVQGKEKSRLKIPKPLQLSIIVNCVSNLFLERFILKDSIPEAIENLFNAALERNCRQFYCFEEII